MSSSNGFSIASLPPHCTPTSPWLFRLSSAFHTCVPTSLAFLSTLLGICSIIAWLFAQVPQIYKNWALQSASGLSIYFLLEWLAGDVTNLAGALLTGQASWQVGVATYYVIVDVCLSGQYFYYVHLKPGYKRRYIKIEENGHIDMEEEPPSGNAIVNRGEANVSAGAPKAKPQSPRQSNGSPKPKKKPQGEGFPQLSLSEKTPLLLVSTLLPALASAFPHTSMPNPFLPLLAPTPSLYNTPSAHAVKPSSSATTSEQIGALVSWASTFLYLGSRLPQLYKNFRRRSTAGLSPYMFLSAFLGNLFYSTAILANPLAWNNYSAYGGGGWAPPEGNVAYEWRKNALPFFLGAAGVLVLDGAVGVQFLWYGGDKGEVEELVEVEVAEGILGEGDGAEGEGRMREESKRNRRRIRSWMRGWVPSTGTVVEGRDAGTGEDHEVEGERRPLVRRGRSDGEEAPGYGGTDR